VKVIRDGDMETIKVALKKAPGEKLADGRSSAGSSDEALAGVGVGDLDDDTRNAMNAPKHLRGAVVTQVEETSAAYEAGLRPGDVITEINRSEIEDAESAVTACEHSNKVTLVKIWRDGGSRYLVVDEAKVG